MNYGKIDDWCWVHVAKTGGGYVFEQICVMCPILYTYAHGNVTNLKKVKRLYPEITNFRDLDKDYSLGSVDWDYNNTKFIVTKRNPYERMWSMWHFFYVRPGKDTTFEQFIKSVPQQIKGRSDLHTDPIVDHVKINGEVRIDHLIDFENMENDWEEFLSKFDIALPSTAKNNKVRASNYISSFDISKWSRESIDIVNESYKEDFEYFGYEML